MQRTPRGTRPVSRKRGVLELTALGVTVRGYEEFVAWKLKDKAGRDNRYRRHWNNSLHLEQREDGTVRGRCYLISFQRVSPGNPRDRRLRSLRRYSDKREWRMEVSVPPPRYGRHYLQAKLLRGGPKMTGAHYDLTAREIVRRISRKEVSASEIVSACLGRIDQVDGDINAICTRNETAIEQAKAVDQRLNAGEAVRPLEGYRSL